MKKCLAFFLALALITVSGAALAYEDEITFLDFAWYESYKEIETYLTENNLATLPLFGYPMQKQEFGWTWIRDGEDSIKEIKLGDDSMPIFGYDLLAIDKPIGGYAEGVSENMNYILDGDDWKLYSVRIIFDVPNPDEAHTDLLSKLSSVYGGSRTLKADDLEFNYWLGANDTFILMLKPTKMYPLQMLYGKLDVEKVYQSAVEKYTAPSNNASDSTDGL